MNLNGGRMSRMDSYKGMNEKTDGYEHVSFEVEGRLVKEFLLLLQYGFAVRAHVGCSVNDFLRNEIGAGSDTIEKIQSIFLEGSPVDDLDQAIVRDGATLALSAAMPGLVGATMRRGGAYASFRGSITYRETGESCSKGDGLVQLKLFNVLLKELGYHFLEKGILVKSADLTEFLRGQSADFWQGCKKLYMNGIPVKPDSLEDSELIHGSRVFLTVTVSS